MAGVSFEMIKVNARRAYLFVVANNRRSKHRTVMPNKCNANLHDTMQMTITHHRTYTLPSGVSKKQIGSKEAFAQDIHHDTAAAVF